MAVGLVFAFVVRNQVVKRKPVVGNNVVDAVKWPSRFFDPVREKIVASVKSSHYGRHEAGISSDKTADVIPELAVPLVPEHAREAGAQLISAAGIPRLSDQTSPAEHGVGAYRREQRRVIPIDRTIFGSSQNRRQIEAKTVHMHFCDPVSKTV